MKFFRLLARLFKALLGMLLGVLLTAIVLPDYLPLGTPSSSLSSFAPPPLVDMHVHVAGFGYGNSGCFVSRNLRDSYKRYFYLWAFGVSESELRIQGDGLLVERLSARLAESRFIGQAVVLALDGVFDADGNFDRGKTQVYVPNEFVQAQTAKYDNLLYGASINPYRRDAIEQLQKAKSDGAVLVKWIPPIMHIDPADPKLVPFYEELVRLDLPLLTHAGQERAFAHAKDEFGDPMRLELPLKLGVRVIAAHLATTGTVDGEEMIDRLIPLFDRYPNLYSDISSLTQVNKLAYIDRGLLNQKLFSRVAYGSDWPLQFFPLVSPWLHAKRLRFSDMQYIASQPNVFDRDVLTKVALGVPPEVFQQTPRILGLKADTP